MAYICEGKGKVVPGAVVRKPGNQTENKTGSWRSFRPIVMKDKCIGCKMCEMHCPDAAIKVAQADNKANVDYDYCKGCLICEEICPVKAIRSETEEK
jgi:pyruvate ferredoxin oxidoreductase delta subunit